MPDIRSCLISQVSRLAFYFRMQPLYFATLIFAILKSIAKLSKTKRIYSVLLKYTVLSVFFANMVTIGINIEFYSFLK